MVVETFDIEKGERAWTTVMSLDRVESASKHVRITLEGKDSPIVLTVTEEHLVLRDPGHVTTGKGEPLEVVDAAKLRQGDTVPTFRDGVWHLSAVTGVEFLTLTHKNVLVTRAGLV